ncbi:MAG: saccharopine dehydrogenase NADP-binding domain-containing protein [Gemmataceae bacterium]
MNPVVVVGGYGTFGALVCRELAARGVSLTVAGRDRGRADTFAASLGYGHNGAVVDLTKPESFQALLTGRTVAVNCAGPFADFDPTFLEGCLASGCHYADITDDRRYAATVRRYGPRFAARGLTVAWGCSSLPGISGALAQHIRHRVAEPPRKLRVTLFIGNDNPKGGAAVASLVLGLGRPIRAPQGTLRGGWGREIVPLPPPFGRRLVFNFDSPDYDVLDAPAVTVKVGFELGLCTLGLSMLGQSGWRFGRHTAAFFARAGNRLKDWGCSGGAVMVEAFFAHRAPMRAAVATPTEGQRMAALPCALATLALLDGVRKPGAYTAYELLGAERLLNDLEAAGFTIG